ncbi:hypothetical protein MtrunA17_Chr3g0095591 [Medicago truncatula]|uniref:Uncharacterized protein n=1 Tax=Medicago truncatula TaxID=3880 RepID=A0A396IML4_MEDTR|nr:hypothetical protein MtrunA17_Chr3g0095591 [Medicago truncatula]
MLISDIIHLGGILKALKEVNFFTDEQLDTETGKVINGRTLRNMNLIERDAYTKLSIDLRESDAVSNLMDDFPPICKQDPLDVQMNFIKDHFAVTSKKIRLEDVLETMYGGALPVAKSRKIKRKALTKGEYLGDAPEQPAKKVKKAKKERATVQENIVGPAIPTIQEEVEDLEADKILTKRTRSGKSAVTSQSLPDQPSIPKKKRNQAIRKLKVADYLMEEEDQIEAATDLEAEDAATLQKALEIAKDIEVHATRIVREDVGTDAQEVIKAAEVVQEFVATEVGSLLMVTTEEVQEGNVGCSEADTPEASRGNLYSLHSTKVIEIESSSTSTSLSTSISTSSTSSDFDNVPLSRIYTTLNKGLSPSTKLHKKPANKIPYEPVDPSILNSIGEMSEMRNKVCERLPADHPFQPPMIKPLSFVPADAEVVNEPAVPEPENII